MTIILLALKWFYNILVLLLMIRVFGSWFIRNPYASRWYMFVIKSTEPILSPCRNLISRFQRGMMVDFSPILAFFLLSFAYRILAKIIYIVMA